MLKRHTQQKKPKDSIADKIRDVAFFHMFRKDREAIDKILGICEEKKIPKGKMIIKEGETGDSLYIILRGEIEITKKTMQNEAYTVNTLNANKGVVYVGELGLIDRDTRSASVRAKTDCDCLVIGRQKFIKFGDENPRIGLEITRSIARIISGKLRKSNTDVITLFSALVDEIDLNE